MFRPTLPIETERLLLRPFTDADIDELHALHSRSDVARYLYWEPRSREEVQAVIAKKKQQITFEKEGDMLTLAVVLPDTGHLIGDFSMWWVSETHRSAEIGFLVHPDHHGRGYAAEAAKPLLAIGFELLGLHRIFGRCDGRNAASIKLMERLGMRREAHLLENEFVKGEWTDEVVCAMLAREWRGRILAHA